MVIRSTLRTLVLSVALVAPAAGAFAADGGKCTIATKPDTEVGKACAAGGVKEAKKKMKEMTKAAKKNGWKGDCDTCHKDTEAKFDLTDSAKQEFEKMQAALKKAS
jgi:hypothetical protein